MLICGITNNKDDNKQKVNSKRMLLYVVCTVGEFVWNEGDVGPATCYLRLISRCVIF